ncbi:4Fe-4S dicluster domain-containing protein [Candidatus Synechococcus calcipolaris G9]|uniref:Glycolate oxidase iron-sulfur subunit n=1 Tax=Candidatus Synechococcus calcipolaris G9 TaxID=1497997 RepID=A0ABT6F355_9SYNE|nr:heterodisulfide reductase-related iron-sulfur binding cluster [Candidatus Synechococcus calcipolaris]MDG2992290.1 4Fe-4S dicluster domain-containing protein [Candidatus Synechococcus calcipolaris G9]
MTEIVKRPGFDQDSPPEPKLIDACVHCGFCLATCPSYRIIGKETDSPRGRIYLMDGIHQGQAELSPAIAGHFDSCLGCLACVTTCPSGVEYDKLIAAMRPQVNRQVPRPWLDTVFRKLLFSTLPYPRRLRPLMFPVWLYQKIGLQQLWHRFPKLEQLLPKPLRAMERLLPPLSQRSLGEDWPNLIPAQGKKRYRVGLILGCVQRVFLPEVNAATIRVLAANGCEIVLPTNQGCCAALPHHQGEEDQARQLARQMIDIYADMEVDAVIINASGCGHTLKDYGHLLENDPDYQDRAIAFAAKVKDVQEFLDDVGLVTPLSPLQDTPLSLVYQDACHMIHGQKITVQPRRLLRQIPGVQLREPIDAALCCGSAGIYNILQPDVAEELGKQKVKNLLQTQAQIIVSANVGCTVQIQRHLGDRPSKTPIYHPMQLLDLSIKGERLPAQS